MKQTDWGFWLVNIERLIEVINREGILLLPVCKISPKHTKWFKKIAKNLGQFHLH